MTKKVIFPEEHSIDGAFVRQVDQFEQWVKRDGSSDYLPEKDRYHLYVSLACPWAHRIIIMRRVKGLENVIGMTIVDPIRNDQDGWKFYEDSDSDEINGFRYLKEAYLKSDPEYTGRVTVPVLWDKKNQRIVSNNDDDLMRMLNSEFSDLAENNYDFYPEKLRNEIDEWNEFIYQKINNGVYLAGFASTQESYEKAVRELFDALDVLEKKLENQTYLFGEKLVETDWRLFVTLIRFDAVYHGHFKCNKKMLVAYKNLHRYTKALYQQPGIAETVNFDHIKRHYYQTHPEINPSGIVPVGPDFIV